MNFIRCGLLGWCIEVFWTGLHGFMNKDKKLMGNTSLLMFPIYGLACSIKYVYTFIKHNCFLIRGFIYTVGIFFVEFSTGYILKQKDKCPWDYSNCKYNFRNCSLFYINSYIWTIYYKWSSSNNRWISSTRIRNYARW